MKGLIQGIACKPAIQKREFGETLIEIGYPEPLTENNPVNQAIIMHAKFNQVCIPFIGYDFPGQAECAYLFTQQNPATNGLLAY